MTLPVPNLDDRRFQDLVDDAKRLVHRQCPEWTDHNVSDPGVALIESFAQMVDHLLYRLNRVPERSYVTFLELMGVELFPPSAAKAPVTFWLTAPLEEDRVIEAGTEVATRRRRNTPSTVFRTIEDLPIIACERLYVMTSSNAEPTPFDQTPEMVAERPVAIFSNEPLPGDTLLIGLDRATPQCAVALAVDCDAHGHGVDPTNPPLVWEALCEDGWASCDVEDATGGFNEPGDLVLHVPESHVFTVIEGRSAAWLRCRVVPAVEDQPAYTASPLLRGVTARTVGGTVSTVHGEDFLDEIVGVSEGVPGQRLRLRQRPVVPAERPMTVEVSGPEGWEPWTQVSSFAESGPSDRHWRLSAGDGMIVFGPGVRLVDGSFRSYGAIPPAGAHVRVRRYRVGGGRDGNIAAHEIVTLKSAIPFVGRVDNRRSASGGVDGETLEAAKVRGPLVLGTRNRAVTARDYEQLAREATPEVARVRCLPVDGLGRPVPDDDGAAAGVRVLLVPSAAADATGRIAFRQLVPSDAMQEAVRRYLEDRRMVGARVVITPPHYLGLTAVVRLRARPLADPVELRDGVLRALFEYFDPLIGGPEGDGWAFGRPILLGEVFSVAQRVPGVDLIEDARLFPADPITGQRGEAVTRIDLDPDSLAFSYGHQVQVID